MGRGSMKIVALCALLAITVEAGPARNPGESGVAMTGDPKPEYQYGENSYNEKRGKIDPTAIHEAPDMNTNVMVDGEFRKKMF